MSENLQDQINSTMNLQWYPGHMTKTKRMLIENIGLVDIVIELLDARIPLSSRNPDIDEIAKNKLRIVVINKADLAEDEMTKKWAKYYTNLGIKTIITNSLSGKGISEIINVSKLLMKPKIDALKQKGRLTYTIRSMILGIPNVGKSTLINKYAKRDAAKTADKPGVTRGKQWIKVSKEFELLDTPGILWPKFEDKRVGLLLAFSGAINDNIIDIVSLSHEFIKYIREDYGKTIAERYKINFTDDDNEREILEMISRTRGHLLKGDNLDLARTAVMVLDEFRGGKIARITLDKI